MDWVKDTKNHLNSDEVRMHPVGAVVDVGAGNVDGVGGVVGGVGIFITLVASVVLVCLL